MIILTPRIRYSYYSVTERNNVMVLAPVMVLPYVMVNEEADMVVNKKANLVVNEMIDKEVDKVADEMADIKVDKMADMMNDMDVDHGG